MAFAGGRKNEESQPGARMVVELAVAMGMLWGCGRKGKGKAREERVARVKVNGFGYGGAVLGGHDAGSEGGVSSLHDEER